MNFRYYVIDANLVSVSQADKLFMIPQIHIVSNDSVGVSLWCNG